MASLGTAGFLAYFYLFGEPLGMAVGQVMLRKLRNLSNMTVSCYTNLSSIPVFLIWCFCVGDNILGYESFGWKDWTVLCSVSILLVFAQNFYFISLANLPAPAL